MTVSSLCLVLSGLLWGTGGLIGTLLRHAAGLTAASLSAYRLLAGGGLIVAFLTLAGRRWPAGRAAWSRIAVSGALSALFQGCYFGAISLTSVSLATLHSGAARGGLRRCTGIACALVRRRAGGCAACGAGVRYE